MYYSFISTQVRILIISTHFAQWFNRRNSYIRIHHHVCIQDGTVRELIKSRDFAGHNFYYFSILKYIIRITRQVEEYIYYVYIYIFINK